MNTTKLNKLVLAGLAVSTLVASAPLFAHERDDDRGAWRHQAYERRGAYERDHRDFAWHERHRFERLPPVVVERPVYVPRETVIYREAPPVYYYDPTAALVGAVASIIVNSR